MTPEALAETHAAAFPGKGWTAAEFATYLADPTVTVHGTEQCFAVIRRIREEAEILTLATHPDHQGTGRATQLLAGALAAEKAAGATSIILDVADDNMAARALYDRAGFSEIAQRKDYYRRSDGGRITAQILRKAL